MMTQLDATCPDCDDEFSKVNGFRTERGLICGDCATDPNNPNTPETDMPTLEEMGF